MFFIYISIITIYCIIPDSYKFWQAVNLVMAIST